MSESVPVYRLAEEWGITSGAARRVVLESGCKPHRKRDKARRNQQVLCVTVRQAEELTKARLKSQL